MTVPMRLKTLLADYPVTHALRCRDVGSDLVELDFAPYATAFHGFKSMVRDQAFDGGELAIATFLQAKDWGKPLTLLPATISGRFQHRSLLYNIEREELRPEDLAGKCVGVRAYTQTTGMWIRGILQNQYGVEPGTVTWLTFEDAHVAEYRNPPNVLIAPDDKKLLDMLFEGELDAAILGLDMPDDPRLRSVFPDPDAAARDWYEIHRAIHVNHMFVVRSDLPQQRPEIVAELFRMLKESKARANLGGKIDMQPFGLESVRSSLELAIRYCHQQGLIRRLLDVEELFDDVTIGLK